MPEAEQRSGIQGLDERSLMPLAKMLTMGYEFREVELPDRTFVIPKQTARLWARITKNRTGVRIGMLHRDPDCHYLDHGDWSNETGQSVVLRVPETFSSVVDHCQHCDA